MLGAGVSHGLLHGRLSAEEKADALAAFAAGRTNVLIATTVVEVRASLRPSPGRAPLRAPFQLSSETGVLLLKWCYVVPMIWRSHLDRDVRISKRCSVCNRWGWMCRRRA